MNVKSEMLFKDSMPTRSKQSKLKVFVSGGTTILGRRIISTLSNHLHGHAFSFLCGIHSPDSVEKWEKLFPNVQFVDMGPSHEFSPQKIADVLNEWGIERAVDRMLIIPHEYHRDYFKTLIEGAKLATVRHFILISSWTANHCHPTLDSMSLFGADEPSSSSDLWLSRKYREMEESLIRELVDTCSYISILRIGPLQQNLFKILKINVKKNGTVYLPFGSSVAIAPVNAEEIPRAIGTILADFENHSGTHVLTGPELLNGPGLAKAFELGLEKPIKFKECSLMEMKDILEKDGWTEEEVMKILEEFELFRLESSKSSEIRHDLHTLIGRDSITFSAYIKQQRSSLRGDYIEE